MDLRLDGKAAVVAGGSSGLGLAVAQALATEGCRVSIGARDPDRLAQAAATLPGEGHLHRSVDVRDADSVSRWIEDAAGTFGHLHIVVANAGGPPAGTATQFDVAGYREAVELSLLSQIGMVQAALPHLREAGWGRVLFITSQSVRQPIAGLALSNTARLGILGYAKSLVDDLGAGDITVNVLAPGSHDTPRLRALHGGDPSADGIPLGRVGRPEEFGAAAAFLASEQASFITGVVLPVDGGSIRAV